jgi:hypothetical protein
VAVAAAVPALALPTGTAQAAWSASGTGSATGATDVVPAGSTPSARDAGTTVFVAWNAVTLPGGPAVSGYELVRTDTVTGASVPAGTGCSGVVTTTNCTETGVTAGSWSYSVTPVLGPWTGPSGPAGPPVTVP